MKHLAGVLILLSTGLAFAQHPGSRLYIPPPSPNQILTDGDKVVTTSSPAFNLVLQAEIFREHLPFQMVADSAQADYVMQWAAIPEENTAHAAFGTATGKALYTVSASVLGKDKDVVWAGNADKKNLRDAAEDIVKQLKDTMKHAAKHKK